LQQLTLVTTLPGLPKEQKFAAKNVWTFFQINLFTFQTK